MKLPNGELAVVELEKLTDYCLSPSHPRGRHKARVFFAALGVAAEHAAQLRKALLRAAREEEAIEDITDGFGIRSTVDFIWDIKGRSARIRSAWIIRAGDIVPRFITCFLV